MAVIINISLDAEADKDILAWLREQSNRSAAVREAIRSHIAKKEGVTLADVLAEIRGLPSKLSLVAAAPELSLPAGKEPEGAAANLDGLLDRLDSDDWG